MSQDKSTRSASRYWASLIYFLDQRPVHFLLIACLAVAAALTLHTARWRWAEVVDHTFLDAYFTIRGPKSYAELKQQVPEVADVVLVGIDKGPLPRSRHADLLDKLSLAKIVALDLTFDQNAPQLQPGTGALIEATKEHGRVILGAWEEGKWLKPSPKLWNAARQHAHLSVVADQDLVIRRVRLFESVAGEPRKLPSLGLSIAAAVRGQSLQDFVETKHIPVDDDGQMLIDYAGGRECFEGGNFYTYDRVLDDNFSSKEDFAGKTVIIGENSSPGMNSDDIKATPFGSLPGLQVHANIAATLLNPRGPPSPLAPGLTALIALACSLLLMVPLLRWPLWGSLIVALAQAVLIMLLGAGIFWAAHRVLPASVPVIAVFLTYNAVALYEYRRVRATLGQFIGREMAPQALSIFARLRLGGRVETASAFFCDLRGFTGLAQHMKPEVVAQWITDYTSALERVVTRHKGRPIDYQGDGVFVLFEPALAGGEYSMQAVQAALEFEEVFSGLQQKWCDEGMPRLEIGIGIATGEMMIGIVGAEDHKKFGALGDTVNVAARLQGLSRECGYVVLLTEETYERVRKLVTAIPCGSHFLKGRDEPVEVYGVECSTTDTVRAAAQPGGFKGFMLSLRRRLAPTR